MFLPINSNVGIAILGIFNIPVIIGFAVVPDIFISPFNETFEFFKVGIETETCCGIEMFNPEIC